MRNDIPVFTDMLHFGSPALAARFYKTSPHILFPDADWTIWVDGNVFLNKTPQELVGMCKHEIGVLKHAHRDCIYAEAAICKENNLDDARHIERAVSRYRWQLGIPEHYGLSMNMLIIRKNTQQINMRNQSWWQEICYGSIRDQISFPAVFDPSMYMPTVDFTQPNELFTRVI